MQSGTKGGDFKYQGQERNEDLGLNWDSFKWRNYDYAIGRFMSIDPLAEQMRRFSPYTYAFNNPIYFIDPDGMAPESTIVTKNEDGTYTVTGGDAYDNDNGI
ncbi:RHS repeat-associated core domain-containing protein [Neptunitalea lumnitzerae]|uniref:RHS repeat-associated core domain-containing protein n=1 Tax=Neptunitalea lumnitzerae TaxID=2965509 RepID=A0ABQ5MG79_9FLAO|nr:hypothetical protein Y10_07890 [Neptunitalea sp. Y10]